MNVVITGAVIVGDERFPLEVKAELPDPLPDTPPEQPSAPR